ncbi:hypothetical protein AWQ22_01820 [Picosynechococcus sp. PCC 7117]|nr:hypothetical protein AWQ22_01820 [Picosynechococcus sp. PCC 7117]
MRREVALGHSSLQSLGAHHEAKVSALVSNMKRKRCLGALPINWHFYDDVLTKFNLILILIATFWDFLRANRCFSLGEGNADDWLRFPDKGRTDRFLL